MRRGGGLGDGSWTGDSGGGVSSLGGGVGLLRRGGVGSLGGVTLRGGATGSAAE